MGKNINKTKLYDFFDNDKTISSERYQNITTFCSMFLLSMFGQNWCYGFEDITEIQGTNSLAYNAILTTSNI